MAITVNIYYNGVNGNAKKFAEEMVSISKKGTRSYDLVPFPIHSYESR